MFELGGLLTNQRKLWILLNPGNPLPGIAILQIDSAVPALVVKSVFETVARAKYPHVSFMVGQRGDGATGDAG